MLRRPRRRGPVSTAESWVNLAALAVLAAAPCVVGCGSAGPVGRPYPTPSPEDLLSAVHDRQVIVTSMTADAIVTRWRHGQPIRSSLHMAVGRGGSLRFEEEVASRGTVAVLTVDRSDRFRFIDNQQRVFSEGPACPPNVATLVGIPLAPDEVAAILLGDAALGPAAPVARVEWDARLAADVLVLDGPAGAILWLGLHRAVLAVSAWDVVFVEGATAMNPLRWRVSYDHLERKEDGMALPRLIRFAPPGEGWEQGVQIEIRERTLNPILSEATFMLTPPAGYTEELAVCAP